MHGPCVGRAGTVRRRLLLAIAIAASCSAARAETVNVKYRGPIDLAPFTCEDITRSSFIDRVCYDRQNTYMLIKLNGIWYHYCEINADTVSNLLTANRWGAITTHRSKGSSIAARTGFLTIELLRLNTPMVP